MKEPDFQFENEWRSAFKGAEAVPSSRVWENIESELDRKAAGGKSKMLFMIQMAAAVSLVMASTITIYNYFDSSNFIAPTSIESSSQYSESNQSSDNDEIEKLNSGELLTLSPIELEDSEMQPQPSNPATGVKVFGQHNNNQQEGQITRSAYISAFNMMGPVGSLQLPRVWLPRPDIHKIMVPFVIEDDKTRDIGKYPLWAGINIAGGTSGSETPRFAQMLNRETADANSFNDPQVHISTKNGFGYSMGIAVGKRLTNRFYIQSGLQYTVQNIQGTTNAYYRNIDNQSEEPIFIFNKNKGFDSQQNLEIAYYAQPRSVNASLEYFSIPLQIGYLIVDRKLGWAITTGISTDFFLRSVTSGKTSDIEEHVTRSRDAGSPFRPVNLSAIFSTELHYNIADNYSIALEPRYSVGLNPVTREDEDVEETRLRSLSVGVKLRYLF